MRVSKVYSTPVSQRYPGEVDAMPKASQKVAKGQGSNTTDHPWSSAKSEFILKG